MGAEGEEPGFRQLAYLGDQQVQTPKGHHIPAAGVGTALGTPLSPSVHLSVSHAWTWMVQDKEAVMQLTAASPVCFLTPDM